jgi:hypothetical protein
MDLKVTQSEAYQYFSDIEKYTERYPWYYKTVDVIERADNGLTAKMFLNVHLSVDVDHALVTAKYTFVPETEVRYEVISGPGQGVIRNSIVIRRQDTVSEAKSTVENNHIPLDLLCYPPPYIHGNENYIFSPGDRLGEYQRMLSYFEEQDLIPLEKKNWGGFRKGDICSKCKKGHLQLTGKKEDTGFKKIDYFQCDYCGSEFRNQRFDE